MTGHREVAGRRSKARSAQRSRAWWICFMCLGYQLANLSAPTTDVTAAPAIELLFVRLLQAVVQTGGDSLLVTFDSTDGAVRSAVRVQRQIPMHDGEQPEDRA